MAAIEFDQTDTSASYNAGTSGATAGVTTAGREMDDTRNLPAVGSTPVTVDAGLGTDLDRGVFRFLSAFGVGETTWDGGAGAAGDYVVNLNISTAGASQFIEEIYIDELQDDGTTYVNVVSATAIQRDISTAGNQAFTLNRGTDFTPKNADSKLSITIVAQSDKSHGNSSFDITPSLRVVTPIQIPAAAVQEPGVIAAHTVRQSQARNVRM